ncbi:hypothetical protein AFERRI_600043 [Acidithiobacillus ferrivorans]|uniref:Uncharacterized protein n=1 Tax=Acidithiobacillus ferrivorans TaxID=160808 RepID=A0A060UT58_9PROT|nr:hypothetical protein AFERRI_600043 [Acidithiobacillus ferrivorans]
MAGPNVRAGLTLAPVSGPMNVTIMTKVKPIASGAALPVRSLMAVYRAVVSQKERPQRLQYETAWNRDGVCVCGGST